MAMSLGLRAPSAAGNLGGGPNEQPLLAACNFFRHPALLALVKIQAAGARTGPSLTALLDEGSQVTLITKEAATRMDLGPGKPWSLWLQVVGSQYREMPSSLHMVKLIDKDGASREFMAAAVNSIAQCG